MWIQRRYVYARLFLFHRRTSVGRSFRARHVCASGSGGHARAGNQEAKIPCYLALLQNSIWNNVTTIVQPESLRNWSTGIGARKWDDMHLSGTNNVPMHGMAEPEKSCAGESVIGLASPRQLICRNIDSTSHTSIEALIHI